MPSTKGRQKELNLKIQKKKTPEWTLYLDKRVKPSKRVTSNPNYNLQILQYAFGFHGLSLSTCKVQITANVSMVLYSYTIFPLSLLWETGGKKGCVWHWLDVKEKRGQDGGKIESPEGKNPPRCLPRRISSLYLCLS